MNDKSLKLDSGDMVMAMRDQTAEWMIDIKTGQLCMDPEEAELFLGSEEANVFTPTDPERILAIPDFHSTDGYRLMQRFALEQAGAEASQHLQNALEMSKPFRRFKDSLSEFPEVEARWFEFETEEMKRIAEDFYEAQGYTVHWSDSPAESVS
jgi:hypothetical protein